LGFFGGSFPRGVSGLPTFWRVIASPKNRVSIPSPKAIWAPECLKNFYRLPGIYTFLNPKEGAKNALGEPLSKFAQSWGRVILISITFLLFYLAIAKEFEPLLLLPIAFGGLLANIPLANVIGDEGFIGVLFESGIKNELFPLIIFMGVGAMTDFGPLLANPRTAPLELQLNLVYLAHSLEH